MNAIAGIWYFDGRPTALADCERMLGALAIYGPQGASTWDGGSVAMGVCQMRILPEDRFDRQPLRGESGAALVADARIDNRRDLQVALGIPAEIAARMADSHYILRAWEKWGEDCISHLLGSFAFALWDPSRRQLFAARDHVGGYPLFFYHGPKFCAFASVPKGLLALPNVSRELDEQRLARHLVLSAEVASSSFFRDIRRIPPGQFARLRAGGFELNDYWRPDPERRLSLPRDSDYIEAFHELFREAIRCRMRAAGKIGSHLSGGLDSSSVTALAAADLESCGARLIAFTSVPRAGFLDGAVPNRFGDEGAHARTVAAGHPNIDHILVRTPGQTMLDTLDLAIELHQVPPIAPWNVVWVQAIYKRAQELGVRRLLRARTGNLGFSLQNDMLLSDLFRAGRWIKLIREAYALAANSEYTALGLANAALGDLVPRFLVLPALRWLRPQRAPKLETYSAINPHFARQFTATRPLHRDPSNPTSARPITRSLLARSWRYSDPGSSNLGARAGWGIDPADPTADKRVLEFCLALPDEQYLRLGQVRSFARRAMADLLPREVLEERRRGLQAADWFERMAPNRNRFAAEIELLEASPKAGHYLDLPRMRGWIDNWPSGGWQTSENTLIYLHALSRAIAVGRFIRRFESPG